MTQDFGRRAIGPERMDLPGSDERLLHRTLDQFSVINRWLSRVRPLLRHHVLDDLQAGQEAHLVDLGAGACDIPVWLLREARRRGRSLRVTAVDSDPRTVRYARARHGAEPGLRIVEGDALDLEALSPFDYLFANHFLHHLPDPVLPGLLADAHRLARRGVVFSDLRRSRFSHAAFSLIARGFRDSFAREDGLLSIRKGFTPQELRQHAGTCPYRIRTSFPGRVTLTSPPPLPRARRGHPQESGRGDRGRTGLFCGWGR